MSSAKRVIPFTVICETDISKKFTKTAWYLAKKSIALKQQCPIDVYDEDGTAIGHFVVDLLIEDQLLVELKACSTLGPEHTAQILVYLRACRLRLAMFLCLFVA